MIIEVRILLLNGFECLDLLECLNDLLDFACSNSLVPRPKPMVAACLSSNTARASKHLALGSWKQQCIGSDVLASWRPCWGMCFTMFSQVTIRKLSPLLRRKPLWERRIVRRFRGFSSVFLRVPTGFLLGWRLLGAWCSAWLCQAAIQQVLQSVVGPGDLLSSELRADFAAEAYSAWGSCPGCLEAKEENLPVQDFAKYNQEELLGEHPQ